MALMLLLGALLVVGLVATARWSGERYLPSPDGTGTPSIRTAAGIYLRGATVGLVGGFWTGALVTGPAMRLAMRLLAVTAGDDAQGRLTEAEEVVGRIELDGTLGLYVFGGLLPGIASGLAYVLLRRWLPDGRKGAVAFGILHLVVLATRLDPLRPDNVDFDLVGPPWLSLVTFGVASVVHGVAVAAFCNRYRRELGSSAASGVAGRGERVRQVAPLVLPALFLVPAVVLVVVPVLVVLPLAVLALRVEGRERLVTSRAFLLAPRAAIAAVALILLPWTLRDLHAILFRS